MKLYLSSSSDGLAKMPIESGNKILFSANASDNYSGDKWWVEADRQAFNKLGCEIQEIDLRKINEDGFRELLDSAQVLHFSGGSVLYLISLIKKTGLAQIIIDTVRSGKILYSGTSAGSMITSKDLSLSKYDDEEKANDLEMKDFSGLGFVDFFIIPHTNNKDFVESNLKMASHLPDHLQTLIFINDKQAIFVEGESMRLITV